MVVKLSVPLVVLAFFAFDAAAQLGPPPRPLPDQQRGRRPDHDHRRDDDHQQVLRQARQVAENLENLQQNIRYRIPGPQGRRLYQQIDQALEAATHFERTLQRDGSRDHIRRDFKQLDGQLHGLIDQVQRATNDPIIRRNLNRLTYADEQLHYAISHTPGGHDHGGHRPGNPSEQQELLFRLARALDVATLELDQTANYVLEGSPYGPLVERIEAFSSQCNRFHAAAKKGASFDQLQHQFRDIGRVWGGIVHEINQIQLGRGGISLLRQAERTNVAYQQLHNLLRMQTPIPQIGYSSPNFPR